MARKNDPVAPPVPLELWRELYDAAVRFQLLAPWRWMDDDHRLGIDNQNGLRLLCVMGKLGEVFGLAGYRGSGGANFLLRLLRGEFPSDAPEAGYYQDALLVDFVPRQELRKQDRAILDQLQFQPAAIRPRLFPKFFSYKPGYLPWFLEEGEARQVLDDLEKVTRFAELVRAQPEFFAERQPEEFLFFPPSFTEPLTLEQFEWHTIAPVPPPADPPVDPRAFDIAGLLKAPLRPDIAWELTAFYSRMSISEGPRPYWPKLALGADAGSGMVLSFQLGKPEQTMSEAAARCLVRCIEAAGYRPATVKLDSINVSRALVPLAVLLRLKLVQAKSLPMANEARRSLGAFDRTR